jgi:hypothetical protein
MAGTKATSGKGLILNIITGTISIPVITPVGELFSLKPAMKFETDDATTFASLGREFITTMLDGGEWKFDANRVSTDTGQGALQTAFLTGAILSLTIVATKEAGQTTTGDTWAFSAYVTDFNPSFEPTKKVAMSGALRTSNGVTFTEGA